MTNLSEVIVSLIAINGGQLVGKTRLQKTIYLLEKCGLGCGLEFDYHHYGPYCPEIAEAAEDAVLTGQLHSEEKPGYHSVPYVVYSASIPAPEKVGRLRGDDIAKKLRIMEGYSAIELELAATMVYLRSEGGDAIADVKRLKPLKATDERIKSAQKLIGELRL